MKTESMEKSAGLSERLARLRPEELPGFLAENRDALITEGQPFAAYMRAKFKEKGVLQQNVFLAADMSENYGYKLIAEEKHTVRRDTILRLCLAAGFDADETREALILYGMAPLHDKLPRDIVFLAAIRWGIRDIHRVNDLLLDCGLAPLVREPE